MPHQHAKQNRNQPKAASLTAKEKRRQKIERSRARGARKAAGQCVRCGSEVFRQTWQQFKNGLWHLREECDGCGKFRRYLEQTATEKDLPGL